MLVWNWAIVSIRQSLPRILSWCTSLAREMQWMFVIGSNTDCQRSVQPEQLRGSWDFAYTAWYLGYLNQTCCLRKVGSQRTT